MAELKVRRVAWLDGSFRFFSWGGDSTDASVVRSRESSAKTNKSWMANTYYASAVDHHSVCFAFVSDGVTGRPLSTRANWLLGDHCVSSVTYQRLRLTTPKGGPL